MSKTAKPYRMVMPGHVCPYRLKALYLLEAEGFEVEDHHLESKEETEEFKREHDVKTTPQTWIDGARVGGYEDLREHFGKHVVRAGETTYRPVVVLFAIAALLAVAMGLMAHGELVLEWALLRRFTALAMTLLALQKLQDVEAFSTMFLNYDLLARRWVPYGYVYPYGEAAAGVLMVAGVLSWLSTPIALFIGAVGAASVFKAVYIYKRELKCACVGGASNVPLGFVSLTENLFMITMGSWTLVRLLK